MGAQKIENGVEKLDILETSKLNKFGTRHIQTCLLFGALVFGYFLRVNISVAIVAMLDKSETNSNVPTYDWTTNIKQLILSSFFWGYVVAQLPAGLLSQKYGAKNILAFATILCSIFTMITPFIANIGDGWQYVCFLRVLVGVCQGVVYPCVHTLLSKWIPSPERGFLSTIVYSGAQLGTVIMLATSGVMSDSAIGWPSIFYYSGGISLMWAIIYIIFGAESPKESKLISEEEKNYIQKYTGRSSQANLPIPWKSIFTSVPFFALLFAHCGFTWGFYTLLTQIPTYMSKALNMDITKNALFSAIPYLAMWILGLIISPLADTLINRGITSVETSRKLFNSIGQWVPMITLIALGYVTKDKVEIAVLLLTIGVGFNSGSFVGYLVNHMDLSPNFSGTLMGITNGLSNLLSIFAPLLVSTIVHNENNPAEWRIVFFITAGTYLVCNLIFVIFGKASIQPWNGENSQASSQNNNSTKNTQDLYTDIYRKVY